jgi:hypothetical protein
MHWSIAPLRTAKIHFQSQIINDEMYTCDNGLGIDLKEHGKDIFGFNKVFHKHPDAKGLISFQVRGNNKCGEYCRYLKLI